VSARCRCFERRNADFDVFDLDRLRRVIQHAIGRPNFGGSRPMASTITFNSVETAARGHV
jgi:hypothetical protein